ncbi:MAG: TonB-dependent receptor [Gemmatimonadota bacterium]
MRLISAGLLTVVLIVGGGPALAQSGVIEGTVSNAVTGQIVDGVTVSLEGTTLSAVSDAVGHYRINGVSLGQFMVEARRVGFVPERRPVQLIPGEHVRLDIILKAAATQLAELNVIGSQVDLQETRRQLEAVPGGIHLVSAEEIQSTRQANLKDVLRFTPGVYVQPRFGAADESQISIRGSGLRNNFHARGINLLVNGMPYRNADGFTDFESLELMNTEAIEVYKGANAFRYGGSTMGGAINLHTRTGHTADRIFTTVEGGSFGFFKAQLASGGQFGNTDYYASYSRTGLDGFRDFSANTRDRVNLHLGYLLSPTTDIRSFYFFAHVTEQLPGALSRGDLDANPRRADPGNVSNRWGRTYDLHHLGLQVRTRLGANQQLEVSPYFQYRDIDHPIFRVIAQVSRDFGAEVRYENTGAVGSHRNRFTMGLQPAVMNMDDRQFDNIQGLHGGLRKDQTNEVRALALYAEDSFEATGRLTLVAGARFDYSTRQATDHFLSDGDQSDQRSYRPLSPRVGALFSLPAVEGQLFANVSASFEPPLLLELNSLTVPGFIDLDGQRAVQYELGTRGRAGGFRWDLSLFDVELDDEILNLNVEPFPGAGFTVPTYRNASRTRHYGLEAGFQYGIPGPILTSAKGGDGLVIQGAYTFARYRFVRDSLFNGNAIPGAPEHVLSGEIKYVHPSGFSLAPSLEWVPRSYFVNSANTERNQGWVNLGIRAEWEVARPGFTAFVSGQNLANARRSLSVQVDNAAGKFFEPMDGRSYYLGFRLGR